MEKKIKHITLTLKAQNYKPVNTSGVNKAETIILISLKKACFNPPPWVRLYHALLKERVHGFIMIGLSRCVKVTHTENKSTSLTSALTPWYDFFKIRLKFYGITQWKYVYGCLNAQGNFKMLTGKQDSELLYSLILLFSSLVSMTTNLQVNWWSN